MPRWRSFRRWPRRVYLDSFSDAERNVVDPPCCVMCDDGGDALLYCEGPCHRHFHSGHNAESRCPGLGMTAEQVAGWTRGFTCLNCTFESHQCFECGELGSTARVNGMFAEVIQCSVPTCLRFYHAACVAERRYGPVCDQLRFLDGLAAGNTLLVCPRHACLLCGREEAQLGELVQCRRCPRAWHRACLEDYDRSGQARASTIWEMHDRAFVYCASHPVNRDLGTPARTHLQYPIMSAQQRS